MTRVAPAHVSRAVPRAEHLAHLGSDVADRIAVSACRRGVRIRGMKQLDMVQRHLAGLQLQVDRSGVIEFDGDFLAAARHVASGEGVAVIHDFLFVAAGNDAHATVLGLARAQRQPGRRDVGRRQSPAGEILVPRDVARVPCILGEGEICEPDRRHGNIQPVKRYGSLQAARQDYVGSFGVTVSCTASNSATGAGPQCRTSIPRPAMCRLASAMLYSPKWKMLAASTASAPPSVTPSAR